MFLLKKKIWMDYGHMVSLALSTLNLENTASQNLQQLMAGNAQDISFNYPPTAHLLFSS